MIIDKLSERIISRKEFQIDLNLLINKGVSMSLGVAAENVDDSTTRKLLTAAVHFAGSEKNQFKKIAHQIAILITKLNQEAIEKYSAPLGSIWTQLGNFPTRDFVLESY